MMRQQYMLNLPVDYHNSIEEFFAYFTHAPSLVHTLFRLRGQDPSTREFLQGVSQALEKALHLQSKLNSWHEHWSQISSPPVETPSATDDVLFPIILTYGDPMDASIYCGYYSYMIIIHETLKTFGHAGPHEAMVVHFRDQICKSVAYTSRGPLGPFRIGFPLRVAIEVADPLTRSWLLTRLQEFSKTFAAAKPEFLPQLHDRSDHL